MAMILWCDCKKMKNLKGKGVMESCIKSQMAAFLGLKMTWVSPSPNPHTTNAADATTTPHHPSEPSNCLYHCQLHHRHLFTSVTHIQINANLITPVAQIEIYTYPDHHRSGYSPTEWRALGNGGETPKPYSPLSSPPPIITSGEYRISSYLGSTK
ncbi:hypothetical protein Fot_05800 [Forsythia ovata]|uniref:Uncharacterized protein n=1 Tax=Forsythia ovata TaxID=205694 RepID=A0ABD1WR62_9LAMI